MQLTGIIALETTESGTVVKQDSVALSAPSQKVGYDCNSVNLHAPFIPVCIAPDRCAFPKPLLESSNTRNTRVPSHKVCLHVASSQMFSFCLTALLPRCDNEMQFDFKVRGYQVMEQVCSK